MIIETYVAALHDLVLAHKELAIVAVGLISFGESLAIVAFFLPLFSALVALGAMLGTRTETLLMAWLSAGIGAAGGYWLSYALAYRYSDTLDIMVRRSAYSSAIHRVEDLFRAWGVWTVLLGRFSKPVRATVTIVAGMSRMSAWQFHVANLASAVAWTAFVLFSGAAIANLRLLWL